MRPGRCHGRRTVTVIATTATVRDAPLALGPCARHTLGPAGRRDTPYLRQRQGTLKSPLILLRPRGGVSLGTHRVFSGESARTLNPAEDLRRSKYATEPHLSTGTLVGRRAVHWAGPSPRNTYFSSLLPSGLAPQGLGHWSLNPCRCTPLTTVLSLSKSQDPDVQTLLPHPPRPRETPAPRRRSEERRGPPPVVGPAGKRTPSSWG